MLRLPIPINDPLLEPDMGDFGVSLDALSVEVYPIEISCGHGNSGPDFLIHVALPVVERVLDVGCRPDLTGDAEEVGSSPCDVSIYVSSSFRARSGSSIGLVDGAVVLDLA